jgi:hypothetical protein
MRWRPQSSAYQIVTPKSLAARPFERNLVHVNLGSSRPKSNADRNVTNKCGLRIRFVPARSRTRDNVTFARSMRR